MTSYNNRIKVLIAGVGGGGVGMEIMKALNLSEIPYYTCGTDMSEHSLGLFKSDKRYVVPPATHSDYLDKIFDICQREQIQVIFPGSEPDLKTLSENRDQFETKDIFLALNSQDVITRCMDKKETFNFSKNNGIPIPKTVAIESEEDLEAIDFFPVIIKPYVGSGGSKNVFIAQDRDELNFFCKYILKYGGKPLVQEYKGSHDKEYTVGILSDKEGNFISGIAIKRFILSGLSNRLKIQNLNNKNQILAVSSGISQGEVVINNDLLEQCKQIALTFKSKGPLNIQCRFVENKAYLFEINPRFSGTTYMRALAGVNEPDLFIRKYILNENIPKNITPKTGLMIRGLEEMFIKQ